MTPTTTSPITSGLPENFDCKALTIADELFPIDKPPSHAVVNEFARRIAFLVTAPIADQAAGERFDMHDIVALWNSVTADSFEDELAEFAEAVLAFYADSTAPTTGSAPGVTYEVFDEEARVWFAVDADYYAMAIPDKRRAKYHKAASPEASVLTAIHDALNVAYAEGWAASGEGYNYEYPGKNFSEENWSAKRNLAVDHLVNRIAASMGGDRK